MSLESKPSMADNAEKCYKCPACGNMMPVSTTKQNCDVCGAQLGNETMTIGASNEEY